MGASDAKERARGLAARQAGRITYAQLIAVGISRRQVARAVERGDLTRRLPRVYALGAVLDTLDARLWEAVLYAGPGACLTAASGAHRLGLIDLPPAWVHVATPRRAKAPPGIRTYQGRDGGRTIVDGLPVAPIPELLLDLAATADFGLTRRALSVLDFRSALDVAQIHAACRHGRPGSAALRRALARDQPELAHTRSELERAFLLLLEAHDLPIPKFNCRRSGVTPDATWDELMLVVELDGHGNHHSPAQRRRDAERQAILEAAGYTVVRFTWHDVVHRPDHVLATLAAHGVRRRDPNCPGRRPTHPAATSGRAPSASSSLSRVRTVASR